MGLMGLIYKAWPQTAEGTLATVTFWLSHFSVIGMTIGIGLIYAGMPQYEPIAIVASLAALLNMLLFAYLFFRKT